MLHGFSSLQLAYLAFLGLTDVQQALDGARSNCVPSPCWSSCQTTHQGQKPLQKGGALVADTVSDILQAANGEIIKFQLECEQTFFGPCLVGQQKFTTNGFLSAAFLNHQGSQKPCQCCSGLLRQEGSSRKPFLASHCMQVADAYFPADAGRLVSSAVYSLEIKCVKSGLYKPLLYGNS